MADIQRYEPRVVGVTDSPVTHWAVVWAVGAARRHGIPLGVVVACVAQPPGRYGGR